MSGSFSRRALLSAALLIAAVPAPPRARAAAGEPMVLPVHPEPLTAETAAGPRRFTVEVADDDLERQRGLMFRLEMADDHGMLFVFPAERRRAFWMKNTPLALDLVFVGGDGRVRAVLPGEPYSTDTISPAAPARFVLELQAGTAKTAGIAVGDRLRHPEIDRIADAG